MNKKIIYLIVVSALIIVGFLFYKSKDKKAEPLPIVEQEEVVSAATSSPIVLTSEGFVSLRDQAWAVLTRYLDFAKKRDIKNLSLLSYQLTPACKNYNESEQNKNDCNARMDTATAFGADLKKADFMTVWNDSKQIILVTDFKNIDSEEAISRTRGIVYFVIDANGEIKFLSFSPAKGATVMKSSASKEELETRLVRYTEDKDEDGKEDYLEECLSTSQDSSCQKTDPKIRDTDSDGLWDGIEALLYK